jgi:hypothetical protein
MIIGIQKTLGTPMYRTTVYLLGCEFTVLKTSGVAVGCG